MARWKLRIDGVPAILDRWPEEEPDVSKIGGALAECIRPQLEAAKAVGRGTPLNLAVYEKDEGLDFCDEFAEVIDAADYFDTLMSHFYDWADEVRVWIEP